MISYKAIGTIDAAKAEVIVLFDKKNKSIHLHIFCEQFCKTKIPIKVRKMDTEYPIDDANSVIQQIMNEEMIDNSLTFESIEKINESVVDDSLHPIRIIRRYKK